jgi:hypothetical protein
MRRSWIAQDGLGSAQMNRLIDPLADLGRRVG